MLTLPVAATLFVAFALLISGGLVLRRRRPTSVPERAPAVAPHRRRRGF
ncbi:hypothetical protein [Rhodoplanes sp. SY1]